MSTLSNTDSIAFICGVSVPNYLWLWSSRQTRWMHGCCRLVPMSVLAHTPAPSEGSVTTVPRRLGVEEGGHHHSTEQGVLGRPRRKFTLDRDRISATLTRRCATAGRIALRPRWLCFLRSTVAQILHGARRLSQSFILACLPWDSDRKCAFHSSNKLALTFGSGSTSDGIVDFDVQTFKRD